MDAWKGEDLGAGMLFGRVAIELVNAPIPFDRVQGGSIQIVAAPQRRRFAPPHDPGIDVQVNIPQSDGIWRKTRELRQIRRERD